MREDRLFILVIGTVMVLWFVFARVVGLTPASIAGVIGIAALVADYGYCRFFLRNTQILTAEASLQYVAMAALFAATVIAAQYLVAAGLAVIFLSRMDRIRERIEGQLQMLKSEDEWFAEASVLTITVGAAMLIATYSHDLGGALVLAIGCAVRSGTVLYRSRYGVMIKMG